MDSLPDIYPLTGLQIGDIQAYVSHAFLYVAPLSKRLLVMVDNRPWLENKQSKSTRIWQMMVTKYRMSPFMNTRVAHKSHDIGSRCNSNDDHESYNDNTKKSYGWLRLMDSSKLQEKYFHAFMSLTNSLHGFIVFELAWKDVHGINYLNELQTDTSLALEVRTMKKWEFFDPEHASSCISLWFSESVFETQPLKDYLKKLTDIDLQNSSSQSQEVSSSDVPSEDEFSDVQESALGLEQTVDDGLCNMGSIEYKNVYNVDQTLCTLGSPKKKKSWTTIDAAVWSMVESMYTVIVTFAGVFLWPFEIIYIYFRTTATLIYPILCCIWELFLLPIRCAITLTTCFLSLLSKTYYLLKDIWETISSTFEFSYLSETEQSSFDSSVLKELWNDLFSQVFRATRSILNGLVTFFISCNRHRLSLYNHLCVFVRHLACSINLTPHTCRRKEPHKLEHNNEEVHHECDRCK